MPASKSVGGFDLILGNLYNDYWFNASSPQHNATHCKKCSLRTITIHRLEKIILAFGKLIVKTCEVWTCTACLNEVLVIAPETQKKVPATKANFVKLFSKLPKSIQQDLLMNRR